MTLKALGLKYTEYTPLKSPACPSSNLVLGSCIICLKLLKAAKGIHRQFIFTLFNLQNQLSGLFLFFLFLIWRFRWNPIWEDQWEVNQSLDSCIGKKSTALIWCQIGIHFCALFFLNFVFCCSCFPSLVSNHTEWRNSIQAEKIISMLIMISEITIHYHFTIPQISDKEKWELWKGY